MAQNLVRIILLATISLPLTAFGLPPANSDPNGVLRRPIPDKLVVLTFDDGCASHATVVAPILKKHGFGGSFYVCDFDSFWTRKDWYLTWRQMRAMAADGLDVGNHTVGHAGGAGIGSFHAMEDELLAHGVPKPTTIAWPVHHVNPNTFPDLAANGYTFGRSGHHRVYRPTIDNCYDIPSFGVRDLEGFVKVVQQAVGGKIVTICFHGVPDGEHPQVGLDPSTFEEMMQYLKDNNYKVIGLRDLGEYIDSAKAGRLPPTADNTTFPDAGETVKDDKPFAGKDIKSLNFPGLSGASIFQTQITARVPSGTDVTALTPQIAVSEGASIAPASGVARDFTKQQTYTVTGRDGAKKVFTVTVKKTAVSARKSILTIGFPNAMPTIVSGTNITVCVPANVDVKGLAPTFTLSPLATASPASGTPLNLSTPQKITVTAQDGSKRVYTVTAAKAQDVNFRTWDSDSSGKWSDASRWQSIAGAKGVPNAGGREDYILNFDTPGNLAITNDLAQSFRLNQLYLATERGENFTLAGNRLVLTPNRAAGIQPAIHVTCNHKIGVIANPLDLIGDVAVNMNPNSEVTLEGRISGNGRLVFNSTDPNPRDDYHYFGCRLRIDGRGNTYRGGTVINGGELMLFS
ncbi:MAG: polysaccharide deacetylase family protein, partial [Candidatus Nealsonbacteria bacterium]|nr:polysaccharide deacetylase family protein [Candidatus Nealsonbacteria bacterium]